MPLLNLERKHLRSHLGLPHADVKVRVWCVVDILYALNQTLCLQPIAKKEP